MEKLEEYNRTQEKHVLFNATLIYLLLTNFSDRRHSPEELGDPRISALATAVRQMIESSRDSIANLREAFQTHKVLEGFEASESLANQERVLAAYMQEFVSDLPLLDWELCHLACEALYPLHRISLQLAMAPALPAFIRAYMHRTIRGGASNEFIDTLISRYHELFFSDGIPATEQQLSKSYESMVLRRPILRDIIDKRTHKALENMPVPIRIFEKQFTFIPGKQESLESIFETPVDEFVGIQSLLCSCAGSQEMALLFRPLDHIHRDSYVDKVLTALEGDKLFQLKAPRYLNTVSNEIQNTNCLSVVL